MNANILNSALPQKFGDYRFIWVISLALAIVFSPFVVLFKQQAPWLIAVPICLGFAMVTAYEWIASSRTQSFDDDPFVVMTEEFRGLQDYERLMALEIHPPKRKEGKGQLLLFPGLSETTPSNSVRVITDQHGKEIPVISCNRYSALLIAYLVDHLDKATDKSLSAGLSRFGKMHKGRSDIHLFVHDPIIREVIKSDFRGNLLSMVSKGGEKVLKDLIKAVEARAEAERENATIPR